MKILIVAPSFMPALNYGGTTRSVYEICRSLAKENQVTVLTTNLNGNVKIDVDSTKFNNFDDIKVWYHDIKFFRKMFCSFKYLKNIYYEVENSDVVHIQSVFFLPAIFTSLFCKFFKKPYFLSTRGAVGASVIENKRKVLKFLWLNLISWHLFEWAEGIHVTSVWEQKGLENLGFKQKKILIENGVRVPKQGNNFYTDSSMFVEDYLLYVGRISQEKGIDLLIEAYKKSEVNSNLLIVGDDSNEYTRKLKKMIKELNIEEKVFFLGQINDEKWTLYENAKCLMLTSQSESFGNVVLEAMAMKCPVIVTESVGAADLVKKNNAGYVVPYKSEEVSFAIKEVMLNSKDATKRGENGKMAVDQNFTWKKIASRYLKIYEQISTK